MPKLITGTLAVLALLALAVMANTARRAADLSLASETPEARLAFLEPYWRILRPPGPTPRSGAILLSGCDGVHDNMHFWAAELVRQGRVAMILDSHTPRALDRLDAWRLVCAGQLLDGAERSSDLAVALQALAVDEGVTGDVVVLGASHGSWTAMEFAARALEGKVLPGLSRWPAPPQTLLDRVSGIMLLYPYCGILNRAEAKSWHSAPAMLMILAEDDSIVGAEPCLARALRFRDYAARIETAIIPEADHGFDQQEKAPLSTLPFSTAQREKARVRVGAFLAELPRDGSEDPTPPR